MNPGKYIQLLKSRIHNLEDVDLNVQDPKLHELALVSYRLTTGWFGVPPDHSKNYILIYSSRNRCIPPRFPIGPYVISLKKGYTHEQYAMIVAHEMYHRVTIKRPGLHRTWWIDEMIGYTLERHAVPRLGYPEYAHVMHKHYIERPDNFDARTVKETIANGIQPGMERKATELQLDSSILALGAQLEALVGWSTMCKIVGCPNWEDWLSNLTPDIREQATGLLDL